MTMKQTASMALALAVSATAANAAEFNWNYDGNGSWGNNDYWTPTPIEPPGPANPQWDGTDVLRFSTAFLTGNRTLTLDGNRTIVSLHGYTEENGRVITINPGDPSTSRLVLSTGNITNTTNDTNGRTMFDLSNISLQLGSQLESPITATWDQSLGAASNGQVTTRVGKLIAHEDTIIQIQGTGSAVEFNQSNNDFHATFRVVSATRGGQFTINQSNGMGIGSVIYEADHGGTRLGDGTTHSTNFVLNNTSTNTHIYVGADETATITSGLTGIGGLTTGRARVATTARPGTLILAGDNTLSGPVYSHMGTLRVDGDWSDAGDFTIASTTNAVGNHLEGFGTIGMASGRTVALNAAGETNLTTIAPGTHGEVGVLTIGTERDNDKNTVIFSGYSGLRIDLDGDDSDTLVVRGNVNLASVNDRLWINPINPTATSYTLLTYTGELTGEFNSVYYDSVLISDPTAPGSIGGQYHLVYGDNAITLVPEPAALSLLGLGALGLLRRRRN